MSKLSDSIKNNGKDSKRVSLLSPIMDPPEIEKQLNQKVFKKNKILEPIKSSFVTCLPVPEG